jgi:hypothetical protein
VWQPASVADRAAVIRIGSRFAVIAVVVVLLAAVHVRRPATFCLLRATTGVPCPFCGGTTAAVDLGTGHVGTAAAASPLALLLLAAWPVVGAVRTPAWWWRHRTRIFAAVLVLLAAAEIWQLHRFGLIGH